MTTKSYGGGLYTLAKGSIVYNDQPIAYEILKSNEQIIINVSFILGSKNNKRVNVSHNFEKKERNKYVLVDKTLFEKKGDIIPHIIIDEKSSSIHMKGNNNIKDLELILNISEANQSLSICCNEQIFSCVSEISGDTINDVNLDSSNSSSSIEECISKYDIEGNENNSKVINQDKDENNNINNFDLSKTMIKYESKNNFIINSCIKNNVAKLFDKFVKYNLEVANERANKEKIDNRHISVKHEIKSVFENGDVDKYSKSVSKDNSHVERILSNKEDEKCNCGTLDK